MGTLLHCFWGATGWQGGCLDFKNLLVCIWDSFLGLSYPCFAKGNLSAPENALDHTVSEYFEAEMNPLGIRRRGRLISH